jgi:hypothetical protein
MPSAVISNNLFFNIGYSIPQYTVMKKPTVICKLPIPQITIVHEKDVKRQYEQKHAPPHREPASEHEISLIRNPTLTTQPPFPYGN